MLILYDLGSSDISFTFEHLHNVYTFRKIANIKFVRFYPVHAADFLAKNVADNNLVEIGVDGYEITYRVRMYNYIKSYNIIDSVIAFRTPAVTAAVVIPRQCYSSASIHAVPGIDF